MSATARPATSRGPVAVAMSGGLDSSVAAALLRAQGEQVLGLSMLLWDSSGETRSGRCCSSLDLGDARRVAHQIDIPHYTLRLDREFRERVVDPFVQEYLEGRTPSPCVRCNTWVKFDLLLERAAALGAQRVATGHYARIVRGARGWELHAARDASKDQSYYLFELTQEQLAASVFPLGELTKPEVRAWARRAGLGVAEKGESMEVCFVAGGVREFVEEQARRSPARYRHAEAATQGLPAVLVDETGARRGEGAPYYRYTVGQRRGLGLAARRPLYVLEVDAAANRVTVGPRERLRARGLVGGGVHWVSGAAPQGPLEVTVRIRSRHDGVTSRVRDQGNGGVEIEFAEPQAGVAPGQAAVFYRQTEVLGGCWIERPIR
ncbi:MAG TPA: tRNA 2-thiouridine(34) synthase MnmA [Thermoanaerobaculia bacterium]|nr:tRNA 2-thiouridine(34) synthase MnmA [Thermoanaerobaculia bacterium]